MSFIDNFNPMKEIQVTRQDVEECKNKILSQLQNNQFIHLGDAFGELQSYSLNYRSEDAAQVFMQFTAKVSSFMAFQEALLQLVNEGEIMPVKIPNTYFWGGYELRINYCESSGGCTTSGQKTLNIPILVYDYFMRCPSKFHK